ncbi:MAG: hypothetical protein JNL21_23390 [Myxococcales bacterium]|nr:hypothetical protein [Myxococcales bacterium]
MCTALDAFAHVACSTRVLAQLGETNWAMFAITSQLRVGCRALDERGSKTISAARRHHCNQLEIVGRAWRERWSGKEAKFDEVLGIQFVEAVVLVFS